MFLSILNDGGPVAMYSLLLLLILTLVVLSKGFIKKEQVKKSISLLKSISLFALVLGFFWQIIGLMSGLIAFENMGSISPTVVAGGLKISSYSTLFGVLIFLIGRLGVIVLTWMQKE